MVSGARVNNQTNEPTDNPAAYMCEMASTTSSNTVESVCDIERDPVEIDNEKIVKKRVPKRDYRAGKKHAKYSLQDKARVIELLEKDTKTCEIVRLTGIPESTVRNIRKKKGAIKVSLNTAKKYFSGNVSATHRVVRVASQRNQLLAMTEFYLDKWIQRRVKQQAGINGPQIKEHARLLYAARAKKHPPAAAFPCISGMVAKV